MSDEPTRDNSSDPWGKGGPEKKSADPLPVQVEKAPEERSSGRMAWKTKVDRIFPHIPSTSQDRLTNPLPGIVLFLVLLALAALSILLIRPPAPLPASAPADQYSAARALPYIQALAARPRPVGSPAHAEAQAYLIAQLRQLGLEPQVQRAVSVRGGQVAHVENALARLPGSTSGGKAVLLMAHYDSVPTGPGASDDASGVATLLETARALKAGSRSLANDVIFLFSDGEEQGSMGAAAFVEQHPWAKDVGLVLNFDPEVQSGPHYTSDISPNNNWLISQYAEAAPHPLASSLFPEIYHRLPTDNDLTLFKNAGYPGLLFGTPNVSAYYHTALDNAENVDLGSLQHQGSYALALVRHFGDLDLAANHGGDAVYFNALGNHLLVHYPQGWVFPLVALAGLVLVGALVFGLRRKQVALRGVLLGALAALLVAAVLAGVGFLLWRLVLAVYPQYDTGSDTYNGLYYWLAFMAAGMGLAALLHSGLRTRIQAADLALGSLLLWLALGLGSSVWMPGASYMFTWPLLFGSIGLWGWVVLRRSRLAILWRITWLALFAVPAIALVVPLLYEGYVSLSIQLIWIPMAILGLLVGLLALPLEIIARPRKAWLPALMGIIAVGFLVAGHLTSAYTPTRPLQDGVWYGLSADEGKANWIAAGAYTTLTGPDAWTEQFLGEDGGKGYIRDIFPWYSLQTYATPAPLAEFPAPQVEELTVTASGAFHLHVVPAPGTSAMYFYTMPDPAPVTFYVDDRPMESEGALAYWAPPAEGFDLTVESATLDSLTLRVVDHTFGLPTFPGFSYTPRPAWITPDTDWSTDSTMVAKTFVFEKE